METHAYELESECFDVERIAELGGEAVVRGGRHLFDRLPEALSGVSRVGVIGWGSQGAAQARNLRDSLSGGGIQVSVGLRKGSASTDAARRFGFSEADGSLAEMFDVIRRCELVVLLISDAAQAQLHTRIFDALRPGTTLALSHGFLGAYLDGIGGAFPEDVDVIAVCPKGMGPSVRRLYEQGSGINCSVAIEQNVTGRAGERALAWAVALGAPWCFGTTLESEARSDIFGERGILIGGLHGMVEALYRWHLVGGDSPEAAFIAASECITGPISEMISRAGPLGLYEALEPKQRHRFELAYALAYGPLRAILAEIYDEVALGNEIRSVIAAHGRLDAHPLSNVEGSAMWQVAARVRAERADEAPAAIDATSAGIYCAGMLAQVDELIEHGHPCSEVVNESIIEAVDSLNPYMHAKGVAHMVDGCSMTARLGARRWAPRFDYALSQQVLPWLCENVTPDRSLVERFLAHPIHQSFSACAALRPPGSIRVDV